MSASPPPKQKTLPPWVNFVVGGLSGMGATLFVQPIDLIKTRMQLQGAGGAAREHKNFVSAFVKVAQTEGFTGMYNGLSAGLLRQATYTTTRLGVFNALMDAFAPKDNSNLPFWKKAAIGMAAGGVGAVVGTPAEVALIRMTSDGRLPVDQRRNYKNVFDALVRVTREEGLLTLWRGCLPTVARAMALNMAQLSTYAQFKQMLLETKRFRDNIWLHFTASMMSGFCATAVSLPIDLAKTRLQTMKHNEYKGMADVVVKTVSNEGVFALWKGFMPYFLRLGPHTVITFIFMEKLNTVFRNML